MPDASSGNETWPSLTIQGIEIDAIDERTLHGHILETIHSGGRSRILNVNVRAMNLAREHPWFRNVLSSAEIVFCDGAGVQLAARLIGATVPPRITYATWIWNLASFCAEHDLGLYLLGARPGVAETAAERLRERHKRLRITGAGHGYFDHFGSDAEEVVAAVNASDTDVLLVGFGMPLQERWIDRYWTELDAHVFLAGGGCLDWTAGIRSRCPRWMSNNGLEWLFRLFQEPRRLWPRYVIGLPRFFGRVLPEAARRRLANSRLQSGI